MKINMKILETGSGSDVQKLERELDRLDPEGGYSVSLEGRYIIVSVEKSVAGFVKENLRIRDFFSAY